MIELVFEFILVGLVGRWLINKHPDLDTMV